MSAKTVLTLTTTMTSKEYKELIDKYKVPPELVNKFIAEIAEKAVSEPKKPETKKPLEPEIKQATFGKRSYSNFWDKKNKQHIVWDPYLDSFLIPGDRLDTINEEAHNIPTKSTERKAVSAFRDARKEERSAKSEKSRMEYQKLRQQHYNELKAKGLAHLFIHEEGYPVDTVIRTYSEERQDLRNEDEENELM